VERIGTPPNGGASGTGYDGVPQYSEPPNYTAEPYMVPGFDENGNETLVPRVAPVSNESSELCPATLPPLYRGTSPPMRRQ
jgi:hypothetical protein